MPCDLPSSRPINIIPARVQAGDRQVTWVMVSLKHADLALHLTSYSYLTRADTPADTLCREPHNKPGRNEKSKSKTGFTAPVEEKFGFPKPPDTQQPQLGPTEPDRPRPRAKRKSPKTLRLTESHPETTRKQ